MIWKEHFCQWILSFILNWIQKQIKHYPSSEGSLSLKNYSLFVHGYPFNKRFQSENERSIDVIDVWILSLMELALQERTSAALKPCFMCFITKKKAKYIHRNQCPDFFGKKKEEIHFLTLYIKCYYILCIQIRMKMTPKHCFCNVIGTALIK